MYVIKPIDVEEENRDDSPPRVGVSSSVEMSFGKI